MELVSSWADGKTLPKSYIFPPSSRPGKNIHALSQTTENIPVIDLGKVNCSQDARKNVVQQIIEASRDFGFFQVVNHGIPGIVLDENKSALKEFFELPVEEKSKFYSYEHSKKFLLYTSNVEYNNEDVHNWRDAIRAFCSPLEECKKEWPETPISYREAVGKYIVNVKELGSRILELIAEGLGLEPGYFEKQLPLDPVFTVNHYPPCPDPSLTLGAAKHCDPDLITVLLQDDIPGLQVLYNGEWLLVKPVADAFVINVGFIMQIVSNGKLRSVEHRVLTNETTSRTTSALFIGPIDNSFVIKPAEALLSKDNPPIYKSIQFRELMAAYKEALRGDDFKVLEQFMVEI